MEIVVVQLAHTSVYGGASPERWGKRGRDETRRQLYATSEEVDNVMEKRRI
jgi:hypothetical protein